MGLLHWFGGGILAGSLWSWAGAGLLPIAYLTTRRRRNLTALVCGLGIGLGLWRSHHFNLLLQSQRWTGKLSDAVGLVCAPADRRDGYTFLTICFCDPPTTVRAKIDPYADFEIGDYVAVSGSVAAPTSQNNDFDYARYLERYLVFGTMKQPHIVPLTDPPHSNIKLRLWRTLTATRHRIENQLNRLLPEPEASFLAGLLLGSRRLIPPDVLADLQKTGTTHIIAVSGANVVIIASFVLIAARYITFNTRAAWWLSLIIIWCFVALTGISAAAVRGATVATFSLWAKHARRHVPATTALIIPAAVSVVINPAILHDLSWQLSYAAFFGIIVIAPWLHNRLAKKTLKLPSIMIETFAATLTTTPISWWSFGTVSLSGLLVNPLVLGLVPLATGVGALSVVASSLIPVFNPLLRLVTTVVLRSMLTIIHLGSFIPLSWGEK